MEADLQTLLQTVQSELFDLGADLAAPAAGEDGSLAGGFVGSPEDGSLAGGFVGSRPASQPTRQPANACGQPTRQPANPPTSASQPTNPPTKEKGRTPRLRPDQVSALEQWIDCLEAELEPLRQFILPGGTPGAAALHLARTIARRAERRVVALAEEEAVNPEALRYLNRLSDLLFVLARTVNRRTGTEEPTWAGFRW
jgi:cob(I)alamin adenosyltransferase